MATQRQIVSNIVKWLFGFDDGDADTDYTGRPALSGGDAAANYAGLDVIDGGAAIWQM